MFLCIFSQIPSIIPSIKMLNNNGLIFLSKVRIKQKIRETLSIFSSRNTFNASGYQEVISFHYNNVIYHLPKLRNVLIRSGFFLYVFDEMKFINKIKLTMEKYFLRNSSRLEICTSHHIHNVNYINT